MIERLLAADAALDRGELELAEKLFAQVAGADERNAIAVVGLGRVAMRRGDADEARMRMAHALALDPEEAAAQRLLAELEDRTAVPEPSTAAAEPQQEAAIPAPEPDGGAPIPAPEPAPRRDSLLRRLLRRIGFGGSRG